MATSKTGGVNRIVNGASLPAGGGQVDIRKQGFTTNDAYGSETCAERLAVSPPKDEELI